MTPRCKESCSCWLNSVSLWETSTVENTFSTVAVSNGSTCQEFSSEIGMTWNAPTPEFLASNLKWNFFLDKEGSSAAGGGGFDGVIAFGMEWR
eukprot:scaffold1362_cov61-Attheya_sp.AAC.7